MDERLRTNPQCFFIPNLKTKQPHLLKWIEKPQASSREYKDLDLWRGLFPTGSRARA